MNRGPPSRETPSAPRRTRTALIVAGAAVAAAVALVVVLRDTGGEATDIVVPTLSPAAVAGRAAFAEHCAACHGTLAGGTDRGPPLIHVIYEPGHHSDASFVRAVTQGVRAHHWRFGDMPPQPDVTQQELFAVIRFVREVQAANGIR